MRHSYLPWSGIILKKITINLFKQNLEAHAIVPLGGGEDEWIFALQPHYSWFTTAIAQAETFPGQNGCLYSATWYNVKHHTKLA